MKTITKLGLASVLALSMTSSAYALDITPNTGVLDTSRWEGPAGITPPNSQAGIIDYIEVIMNEAGTELPELWKSNYDDGTLEGDLSSSYSVVYSGDPNDATITYNGGDVVGPVAFLLVKDGSNDPYWYLYDLTALNWNGTDDLVLSGFWTGNGAISNLGLFGNRASVPDGGLTILLLGAAMAGLGFANRKLRKA